MGLYGSLIIPLAKTVIKLRHLPIVVNNADYFDGQATQIGHLRSALARKLLPSFRGFIPCDSRTG